MCESTEAPKYDGQSDWCHNCVLGELEAQTELDRNMQARQYI